MPRLLSSSPLIFSLSSNPLSHAGRPFEINIVFRNQRRLFEIACQIRKSLAKFARSFAKFARSFARFARSPSTVRSSTCSRGSLARFIRSPTTVRFSFVAQQIRQIHVLVCRHCGSPTRRCELLLWFSKF
ncbi:hypothetical protein BVRB_3g069830 [Beta vulgaris subsp. vulgaris]|nr:hypothetical protein BVRB_3g069830 [Beta vulgaris subsp. vulgaris]